MALLTRGGSLSEPACPPNSRQRVQVVAGVGAGFSIEIGPPVSEACRPATPDTTMWTAGNLRPSRCQEAGLFEPDFRPPSINNEALAFWGNRNGHQVFQFDQLGQISRHLLLFNRVAPDQPVQMRKIHLGLAPVGPF